MSTPGPVDDVEPMTGSYDWYAAFRQNPDRTEFDWPPEADEAAGLVLADEVEDWGCL